MNVAVIEQQNSIFTKVSAIGCSSEDCKMLEANEVGDFHHWMRPIIIMRVPRIMMIFLWLPTKNAA
jgi:hypothetical protein